MMAFFRGEHYDVVVRTHGCCFDEGKPSAKAGYGVYFPKRADLECQGRVDGAQNQAVAEIFAAEQGVKTASKSAYRFCLIETDSEYVVTGMTDLYPQWERDGFQAPVENLADFQRLSATIKRSGLRVGFKWIPGGNNLKAAELAQKGAKSS